MKCSIKGGDEKKLFFIIFEIIVFNCVDYYDVVCIEGIDDFLVI